MTRKKKGKKNKKVCNNFEDNFSQISSEADNFSSMLTIQPMSVEITFMQWLI